MATLIIGQLYNFRGPGQNENAGPLVQKQEKSVIKGTKT